MNLQDHFWLKQLEDPNKSLVFKLLKFREWMAQQYDESNHTILPNHQILLIAQHKPNSIPEFMEVFRNEFAHPILKQNLSELLSII